MDPSFQDLDPGQTVPDAEVATERMLERTSGKAMARMRFDLSWESQRARHCDTLVVPRLNLWRDLLPPALEPDLMDRPKGHRAERRFAPGELIAPYRADLSVSVPGDRFDRTFTGRGYVQPRAGRFYPRAIFRELGTLAPDAFQADRRPCRLTEVGGGRIGVDFNHPLADRPLTLGARIEAIWSGGDERGGRCNEVAEQVAANGPGMQARWQDLPTDFWSDQPFMRADESPDAEFYRGPRMVDHIDRAAIAEVSGLYGRLIPGGARILDLMSSWHSHLPEPLAAGHVVGVGMNGAELEANPVLAERLIHDLNADPRLPFADGSFDACVCTVSVEYLTQPFEVFQELARVLKIGAPLVVTFSNRWFPPKAIRLWEALHEYERPGLVIEYCLESGSFGDLETWSLRGLPRPADDKYADRLAQSDPIHAVWGRRIGEAG